MDILLHSKGILHAPGGALQDDGFIRVALLQYDGFKLVNGNRNHFLIFPNKLTL